MATSPERRTEVDGPRQKDPQLRPDKMPGKEASVEEILQETKVTLLNTESLAEATFTERSLSARQLEALLDALQERSEKPNPFGKKVTFEQAKTLLEKDPSLAWSLFNGMLWGAKWELNKIDGFPAVAYDLSPELDIPKQLARLRAIPAEIREATIQNLREQYSNIPPDAFDRSGDDQRGPNKWEELLLHTVSGTESMTEEEHRTAQLNLPEEERLDLTGISWLEATPAQLVRGDVPAGYSREGAPGVHQYNADISRENLGVRARAKGSVA